jgi:hypothetical protein
VTPQWHDEFVALCALFPSGELTEEEWALLQVHLAYCEPCRTAFEQYKQLADVVIPALAASASSETERNGEASSSVLEVVERRLMSQLNSGPINRVSARRRKISWKTSAGLLAAGLVGITCLLVPISRKTRPTPALSVQVNQEDATPAVSSSALTDLRRPLDVAQRQIAALEDELSAAKDRNHQLSLTTASIRQQLEVEQDQRKTLNDEKNALNQQLIAAKTEAQSLHDKSAVADQGAASQTAQNTALEAKVHDLNTALDEKDRMLALDKEFLAHDREIRDLIGARDLYIADIYDVAQNGKTAKPFGRIFYTKDKSLVFYGYDLDKQTGLKQSVAFQAWGSGDDKQNVSLGLFYQDDSHKRWVLRFNDTKTLARLNMVFVTAEPQGGSSKPTGKPVLLAYLQTQPNHP